MSTSLSAYADRFAGRPLMLHAATAALVAHALTGHAGPEASRFLGTPAPNGARYRVQDGAAVLTVSGPLCNRGTWLGSSWGGACYEGLSAQLGAALADTSVNRIVLDLDTPGGEASGCFELAAEIRAAGQSKPVTAFVNGLAASAGYALASAANRIVVTPSATVGSIGVVMLHVDQSRALDRAGLTPTLITAGAKKADRSSLAPLPDGARQDLQAEVDSLYALFAATVAANRGMSEDAVRATEAGCFMGASAVKAGLADTVGTFGDAMAAPAGVPAVLVPPASTGMSAAEVRIKLVASVADAWRIKGRAHVKSLSLPDDVVAEAGAIVQGESDALWGGVAETVSGRAKAAPLAGDWDDVVVGLNSVMPGGHVHDM